MENQNKIKFHGDLEDISPRHLIDEKNKNDLQSFFLILGLIFNDLKGLIFFQKIVEDNYTKPDVGETTLHAAEYSGLIVQLDKLLIATVGEFFKFIDVNKSVISDIQFHLLLKKNNNQDYINEWNDLINISEGSTILSKIARVRSNVIFHYDHSMEELRKGFINCFFRGEKNLSQHKHAFYSIGDDMEHTRMYYADAAVQSYINSLLDTDDRSQIRNAIIDMNQTIQWLLKIYLKDVKNKNK